MKFKTSNYFAYLVIGLCGVFWLLLTFYLNFRGVTMAYYSALLGIIAAGAAVCAARGYILLDAQGMAVYYGLRLRKIRYEDIQYIKEARFAMMSVNMSLAVCNLGIKLKEGGIWKYSYIMVAVADKEAFLEELHNRRPEIEIQRKV